MRGAGGEGGRVLQLALLSRLISLALRPSRLSKRPSSLSFPLHSSCCASCILTDSILRPVPPSPSLSPSDFSSQARRRPCTASSGPPDEPNRQLPAAESSLERFLPREESTLWQSVPFVRNRVRWARWERAGCVLCWVAARAGLSFLGSSVPLTPLYSRLLPRGITFYPKADL